MKCPLCMKEMILLESDKLHIKYGCRKCCTVEVKKWIINKIKK